MRIAHLGTYGVDDDGDLLVPHVGAVMEPPAESVARGRSAS